MEKSISEVIQEKLDGDTAFLESIKDLSDEEKNSSIESKRKEMLDAEFKSLSDKSKEIDTAKEYAKNEKIRAEKAEKALKDKDTMQNDKGLSTKDFYALTKANVPEEDIDEVAEYAAFKKISIGDALKSSVVKATLKDRSEARITAQATTTRQTRPMNTKPDGRDILAKAASGKGDDALPEVGSEEAEAMFWARRGKKPE